MTLTITQLVLATIGIIVLLASFAAQRYRVAGANEALVISGARGAKVRDDKGDLTTTHDHYVTYESLRLRAVHTGAAVRKLFHTDRDVAIHAADLDRGRRLPEFNLPIDSS